MLRPDSNQHPPQPSPDPECAIIVPVYNAFDSAVECVQSVLECTQGQFEVLIYDDASPQGEFADYAPAQLVADPRVAISRNESNLGFVKTCNRAMASSNPRDVVLLNSDTLVTPGWLAGLRQAAYIDSRVGTVTPLTNNGTICSVPQMNAANEIPCNLSLSEFSQLIERVSARAYPVLPTCVGFCVYIRRQVLEEVGGFDEEAFGRGYGEENDFSCRAQALGYHDILDDATFVFHKGCESFGTESQARKVKAVAKVEQKHPGYMRRVRKFCLQDPIRPIRDRLTKELFERWNRPDRASVLHVLHNAPFTQESTSGGGTEYHVGDLIAAGHDASHWSLIPKKGHYVLRAHMAGAEQTFRFRRKGFSLRELLSRQLFDVVHLHHTLGFDVSKLSDALVRHGNYVVSMHDFHLCCPRVNLITKRGRLCRDYDCVANCNLRNSEVENLRSASRVVLSGASKVFCFSDSTRGPIEDVFGEGLRWEKNEHGVARLSRAADETASAPKRSAPGPDRPLRVAFLGSIGLPKGLDLIVSLVERRTLDSGIPIEWHLIGATQRPLPNHVVDHGSYARSNLAQKIAKADPDIVAILSIWPETYCFTVDEALVCGIPVICTPLGGPAERVRRDDVGWVLPDLDGPSFFGKLEELSANWGEYEKVRAKVGATRYRRIDEAIDRYREQYQQLSPNDRAVDEGIAKLDQLAAEWAYRQPALVTLGSALFDKLLRVLRRLGVKEWVRHFVLKYSPARLLSFLRELRAGSL